MNIYIQSQASRWHAVHMTTIVSDGDRLLIAWRLFRARASAANMLVCTCKKICAWRNVNQRDVTNTYLVICRLYRREDLRCCFILSLSLSAALSPSTSSRRGEAFPDASASMVRLQHEKYRSAIGHVILFKEHQWEWNKNDMYQFFYYT